MGISVTSDRGPTITRMVQTATFIGAEWDVTADVMLTRELSAQKAIAEARALALEASTAQIEYAAEHDYSDGTAQ